MAGDEANPSHTEVGYWLRGAAGSQVMRCFMVPRASTTLAGGPSEPEAGIVHLGPRPGSETYGILSKRYLAEEPKAVRYAVTVGDGVSCEETTTVRYRRVAEVLQHRSQHPPAGR